MTSGTTKPVERTIEQKRVAVAQDVLKQINERRYIATSGTYIDLMVWDEYDNRDYEAVREVTSDILDEVVDKGGVVELQKLLDKFPPCEVCGVGSALLSYSRLFDDVKLGADYFYRLDGPLVLSLSGGGIVGNVRVTLEEKLGNRFTHDLEAAFEGEDEDDDLHWTSGRGSEERLIEIMKSVIKHEGWKVR